MSTGADTPPASQGEPMAAEAQHLEVVAKSTKRRHSGIADVEEASNVSEDATDAATPKPSPNKRRRKDSGLVAADEAARQSTHEDVVEADKKRKPVSKAALEAAKQKEKEEKKLMLAAAKKLRQEERAALKAVRDAKKKVEEVERKKRKEQRAQKKAWKKAWEDYLEEHNVDGETVDWTEGEEPECITQTDAGKVYGLKPSELGCLRHHPKVNFKYGNTTKLFNEEEVRRLAFRKVAMLVGVKGGETAEEEDELISQGRKLWEER
ncbi:hypothetical protein SLS60_000300 [Paraconiothyrium brasiliense]|uniref:Uncharacterized protein n=1 Tax=Paraconiothyrium brasiliense TaxID=300254 RepID=A0ABR3S5W6_9PLEO